MEHSKNKYEKQQNLNYVLIACLLTVLSDIFFYRQTLGISIGIYAAILICALIWLRPYTLLNSRGMISVLIAIAGTAALIENVSYLSVCLGILAITTFALAEKTKWQLGSISWLLDLSKFFLFWYTYLAKDIFKYLEIDEAQKRKEEQKEESTILKWIVAWIIPLIFSGIFIALLYGANPIISQWIAIIDYNAAIGFFSIERVLLWLLSLCLVWAVIKSDLPDKVFARDTQYTESDHLPVEQETMIEVLFSKQAVLRSLVIFNLMFAVQSTLDIVYLWGGTALPEGMTYAHYAHRGAYPLIATALLAAFFVLVAMRPGSSSEEHSLIRILVYAWIGQNILLVISSIWRTNLYVSVYSLTYLRVAALIWMGLIVLGLIWIILRIILKKSNVWLINTNIITVMVVLLCCCFVDFGRHIADFNVKHYKSSSFDVSYFRKIGPPAIPALQWLIENSDNSRQIETALRIKSNLELELYRKLQNWRGYTYRNYRLELAIANLQSEKDVKRKKADLVDMP